jgi:hypothetical protein
MTGLFVILVVALAAFYLNDAWRSLERARALARELCARVDVQFLDGSVVPAGIRLEKGPGQPLGLVRRYRFEFATDGEARHLGELSLRGRRMHRVSMELPEGGRLLDDGPPTTRGESRP